MTNLINKSVIAALSFLFVTAFSPLTHAAENPFGMSSTAEQMHVADNHGKCGEGKDNKESKCGEGKEKKEGKCGEGKCGDGKMKKEGKCGEGKCGDSKDKKEGKCGEGKEKAKKCGGE